MSLVTLTSDETDEYYKIGDHLFELCRRYDDSLYLISTSEELYDGHWISGQLGCDIAWKRIQEFLLDYPRFKDNVAKKSQIYDESKGYFLNLVLESKDSPPCIRTSCYKCGKVLWHYVLVTVVTTDGINEVNCNDCPIKSFC